MAGKDADGMDRVDLEWEIDGRNGSQGGTLYGLHESEVEFAKLNIKRRAMRGDTVIIRRA